MKVKMKMIDPEFRGITLAIRLLSPFTGNFISAFDRVRKNRQMLNKGVKANTQLNKENVFIARSDGSKLRLLVLTSGKASGSKPEILWLHGGGYGLGTPEQDIAFIERFIAKRDAFCVVPEYTLSIDKPYPAALEDAYLSLRWLKQNASRYGAKENQIFIGGDSGGGGLALALALYARDKAEIKIAFMMPLYPMIDDTLSTPSMKDNNAPVWDCKQNKFAWQMYLGELFGKENIPYTAAPFRAADLHGLPPAVSYVGSLDPFRDETAYFMNRLKDAGIETSFEIFEGVFHAFDIGRPNSKKGSAAISFLLERYLHACDHYST